jgi:hypothetical protein
MAEIGRRKGDHSLLLALAAGQTVRDAAKASGIGERTATRRVADAEFRGRIETLRAEMLQRAMGKITDGMTSAADTLCKLLEDPDPKVRLGAAKMLLELGCRLRETVELESRIAELEREAVTSQGS